MAEMHYHMAALMPAARSSAAKVTTFSLITFRTFLLKNPGWLLINSAQCHIRRLWLQPSCCHQRQPLRAGSTRCRRLVRQRFAVRPPFVRLARQRRRFKGEIMPRQVQAHDLSTHSASNPGFGAPFPHSTPQRGNINSCPYRSKRTIISCGNRTLPCD